MTQSLTEITDQGEGVHGFYRGQLFLGFVIFSSTGGIAKENPVGGFIAGTLESFGINKGLQPVNRVIVICLPVRRYPSGASAQQVRCQVRYLNPGQ
jgi:hypothetical protein